MPKYLSFLDDASASLVAGLRGYEAQLLLDESKRDARALSQAVIDIHTAIDKGLKHALCLVSPTLLFKKIDSAIVQQMFRDQRAATAPSVFALPTRFETHNLEALLNISRAVLAPNIQSEIWTQFEEGCTALRTRRDQAVHGELFTDSAELLETLTRVLSRTRPVLGVICPSLFSAAYTLNDQLESRLTGIETQVDSGWQVLYDFLKPPKSLTVTALMYLKVLPNQEIEILLSGGLAVTSAGLGTMGMLPPSAASGAFLGSVAAGQGRFWKKPQPPKSPQVNSGLLIPLEAALEMSTVRAMRLGERGLLAPEDGRLRVGSLPGWGALKLEGMNQSFLSVAVLLKDWQFALTRDSDEGTIEGTLLPGRTISAQGTMLPLAIAGKVYMQAEYTSTEVAGDTPAGTTTRYFEGNIEMKRAS